MGVSGKRCCVGGRKGFEGHQFSIKGPAQLLLLHTLMHLSLAGASSQAPHKGGPSESYLVPEAVRVAIHSSVNRQW